jgi:hypothetical protein
MSGISPLNPTTPLAPYQNNFALLGAPQQNLQQFPQHLSNAPGQTVDYFFNVMGLLLNLTSAIANAPTSPSTVTAACGVFQTVVSAIIAQVSIAFTADPNWSSPILPYPGYAANNSVNSGSAPFNETAYQVTKNVIGANSTTNSGGNTADPSVFYIFYWWLTALKNELDAELIQVNHFTWSYLAEIDVTVGVTTKTVKQWIDDSWNSFNVLYETLPQYSTTDGTSLYTLITAVVNGPVTISVTDLVDRIPLPILFAPVATLKSSSELNSFITAAPIYMLIIISGLLYNTMSCIVPAFQKITPLYDPKTGDYVFEVAAGKVKDAFAVLTPLVSDFNSTVVSAVLGNANTVPTSVSQFYYSSTYTSKKARESSVDLNRISGSIIPTLTRLRQLFALVKNLAGIAKGNTSGTNTCPISPNAPYVASLNGFINNLSFASLIDDAIASFADQLDIHYSRWSQNLTNI